MTILKKVGKSLLLGTIVGVAVAAITNWFVPDLIDRLENQSYYMLYHWKFLELDNKKEESATEDYFSGVHIVDIDDRSFNKLGMYWNWNRSFHAELVDNLSGHFPAAIVFDINFQEPEDVHYAERFKKLLQRSKDFNPSVPVNEETVQSIESAIDYDKQFIRATRESGHVFHGVRMADERDYPAHALSQVQHKATPEWHDALNPESTIRMSEEKRNAILENKSFVDGIFPELARAARGIGHLNVTHNEDGVIRSIPLLYGHGDGENVYLPISVLTVASLFGTPPEEIVFEPGKYIDIGRPFKVYKDENNHLRCSYPHVSQSQVEAIIEHADEILNLEVGKGINLTTFLRIGKRDDGEEYISMYCGEFPGPVVEAFRKSDIDALLTMEIGSTQEPAPEIQITRDSDIDWLLTAPYGDWEYYLVPQDLKMLRKLRFDEFTDLRDGESRLVYYPLDIRNTGDELVSNIPVLRGKTLEQLCKTRWAELMELEPGYRREFGETVRVPLLPDNRHLVTYFGHKGEPFKHHSYYDIMKDRESGSLEGGIYLIGSTVPALFDIVSVPLDQEYPGVEVHASLIHSLLTNSFVRKMGAWQSFIILVLVGTAIGFIAYMMKPLPGAILTILGIFIYFLSAMMLFGTESLWIPIARPSITIIMTFTAVMAYRYVTEEKDRQFLQSTFKQYLSPELIDIMYKKKKIPRLGGDEGIRTAYFTDIQSFSTFSEKLGSPTRLVELLNEYLTAMTDILLEHYGTLDKYEGDAIIAFFGAPMPMEDHAHQACRTALRMQERLGELRKKWESEGDKWPAIVHEMRMRIGVNTGPITTGNMGSAVRMNYTMMGDAVNLAARLESAAKQYGIYTMISNMTYDIIKAEFTVRQIDKITVVGKSEPVTVYELISEKGLEPSEYRNFIGQYNHGLELFYDQQWDRAIEVLRECERIEPYREIAPKGMNPSTRIREYAETYRNNPPGPDWDGVTRLTSK